MSEIFKELNENKEGKRIAFLFGEEEFLVDRAAQEIVSAASESGAFEKDFFDCEKDDLKDAFEAFKTYSLISGRRIVVIDNFHKALAKIKSPKSPLAKKIIDFLSERNGENLAVIKATTNKLRGLSRASNSRTKMDAILKKSGFLWSEAAKNSVWREFPRVYENELPNWAEKEIKKRGKTIEKNALALLLARSNSNLREIAGEIEKLIVYARDKTNIDLDDVANSVGANKIYNAFELQKAVGKRDLNSAIAILENISKNASETEKIVPALTSYFVSVWQISEISRKNFDKFRMAQAVGINPMFVQEYINAARVYSDSELDRAFEFLARADYALKTSASSNKLAVLEETLINIIERK